MNFLLDENFPKSAMGLLKRFDYKVYDIRGTLDEGMDDRSIFQLAQEKEAIFLTTDKDFFHTVNLMYERHHGVIVFNLRQPNRYKILEKLDWVVHNIQLDKINSKVILISDTKYFVR